MVPLTSHLAGLIQVAHLAKVILVAYQLKEEKRQLLSFSERSSVGPKDPASFHGAVIAVPSAKSGSSVEANEFRSLELSRPSVVSSLGLL